MPDRYKWPEKLSIALTALQEQTVRDRLAALGFEPMIMTPAEFAVHVEKDRH